MKRLARNVGRLLLGVLVLWVAFTVAMRKKCPPVVNAVRRLNRAVINPVAMRRAGRSGALASVIRHVGRSSGTPYETPVVALPTDDGFVVPLTYGVVADWLNNVLSSGSAVIVNDGQAYRVDHPVTVPFAVAASHIPLVERWILRLYGVGVVLHVRTVGSADEAGEVVGPTPTPPGM